MNTLRAGTGCHGTLNIFMKAECVCVGGKEKIGGSVEMANRWPFLRFSQPSMNRRPFFPFYFPPLLQFSLNMATSSKTLTFAAVPPVWTSAVETRMISVPFPVEFLSVF